MPPEISSAALPPVPTGIPPAPGQLRRMDIGAEVPDLHRHLYLRLMDVHFQMGELLQQGSPHLGTDGGRCQGKRFVAALGLHFEGAAFRSSSAR